MKKTVLIVIRVVCIVGFLVCDGVLGWYWFCVCSVLAQ